MQKTNRTPLGQNACSGYKTNLRSPQVMCMQTLPYPGFLKTASRHIENKVPAPSAGQELRPSQEKSVLFSFVL